jgi:hypothetical protein
VNEMKTQSLLAIVLWGAFLTAQSFAQASSIHVALFLQQQDGQPAGYLSSKSFVARLAGTQLPIRLIRPRVSGKSPKGTYAPTRMLVLIAPPLDHSDEAFRELLTALDPVWRRNWQVAVGRSGGGVTGFATSGAALQRKWSNSTAAPSAIAAVQGMGSFDGRRVVLFLEGPNGAHATLSDPLLQAVHVAGAETFLVDGGVPGPPLWSSGYGRGAPPEAAPKLTEIREPESKFTRRAFHEVNLHGALKDAVRGARGFYLLSVRCPPTSTVKPDTVLAIEIKSAPPLVVSAQAFSAATVPVLEIRLLK